MRDRSTTVRALPWMLALLCVGGCPSAGSNTDAATDAATDVRDGSIVDRPVVDDLEHPDANTVDDQPTDAGPCATGQVRTCDRPDGGTGGTVCGDAGTFSTCDCSGRTPPLPPRLLTPHSVSRATTQRR